MFDHEEIKLLKEILAELVLIRVILEPKLTYIQIAFTKEGTMATQGPVVLNQGQSTTATVLYFDQTGAPMPSTFVPPAVVYTIDHPEFASSTPGTDGQSDVIAYVAAGVANLTATVQGPNGPLTDTETVTCNPVVAPPPVLSSIKIAFSTPA
jgi:hypothetical protein